MNTTLCVSAQFNLKRSRDRNYPMLQIKAQCYHFYCQSELIRWVNATNKILIGWRNQAAISEYKNLLVAIKL